MKLAVKITLFILMIIPPATADIFFPVGTPEDGFIYDRTRIKEISLSYDRLDFMTGPFKADLVGEQSPVIGLPRRPAGNISTFFYLTEDFRSARYARARADESIRGGLTVAPTSSFSAYANFLADERLAEDPNYMGKKWRGLAGEIENAFVTFSTGSFDFLMGRFASFWGPSRQSLILAETARPMDALSIRYRLGRFMFTYQTGKLDRVDSVMQASGVFQNRYFAGHRLDIRFSNSLYAGLFETVIYGGEGRGFEAAYLNPLMFYHAFQLNEGYDDNTFLGFDVTCYLNRRYKIYGQVLVDDFQIDSRDRADNEPNELGFMLGVHTFNLLEDLEFIAEYTRISNRTYNQILPRNRYVNRGKLIGNQLGPDADRLALNLNYWPDFDLRAGLGMIYQRRGEGRYDDPWDQPWLDVDDYDEPFPTGTVESSFDISLRLTGILKDVVFFDAVSGVDFVDNYRNMKNDNRTIYYISLRATLIISSLFFQHLSS